MKKPKEPIIGKINYSTDYEEIVLYEKEKEMYDLMEGRECYNILTFKKNSNLTLQDLVDIATEKGFSFKDVKFEAFLFTHDMSVETRFKVFHKRKLSLKEKENISTQNKNIRNKYDLEFSEYKKKLFAFEKDQKLKEDKAKYLELKKKFENE